MIFICISFVNGFIAYFFFPETKNLSLEEIGALFGDYDTDSTVTERLEARKTKEENDKDIVFQNAESIHDSRFTIPPILKMPEISL